MDTKSFRGGTSSKVGNILLTEKHLELLGGYQLRLRSFRGVPVRKFESFYLPKKLVIFRGGPVKKHPVQIQILTTNVQTNHFSLSCVSVNDLTWYNVSLLDAH